MHGWMDGCMHACMSGETYLASLERALLNALVALGERRLECDFRSGVVAGMTRNSSDVWIIAVAILGHKGAEAVALASAFVQVRAVRLMHFLPFSWIAKYRVELKVQLLCGLCCRMYG